MMIKYKGQTASLLKDLCLELKRPVNLKEAEMILSSFFYRSTKDLSEDKSLQVLTFLPTFLKPFYFLSKEESVLFSELFFSDSISFTVRAIMKVLEKYVPADDLIKIYACFPENLFSQTLPSRKHALQKAS